LGGGFEGVFDLVETSLWTEDRDHVIIITDGEMVDMLFEFGILEHCRFTTKREGKETREKT